MTMSCNGSILKVNFNALNTGNASLKLYTMNGNLVKESVIQTVAGQNYSHNFDISDIANGFLLQRLLTVKTVFTSQN
jgi:hypothetical protein